MPRRRPSRIGVEHRHHDRHVGAADRQDQQEADRQRQHDQQDEGDRMAAHGEPHQQHHQDDADQGVERMLAAEDQRRARDQALQLGEGHDRAGEGDGADDRAQPHLDQALGLDLARRADAEGLGRRRTPPPPRTPPPGRPANGRPPRAAARPSSGCACATTAPIAPPITRPPMISQGETHARRGDGDADRDHHADDAEEVAAARGHGRATARAAP